MGDQPPIPSSNSTFERIMLAYHFAEIRNMVDIGSGAHREIEDWLLKELGL